MEGSVNNLQSPCSEFNTNGRLGFQTEFVTRKPGENIGFSNSRITDQDNLEEIIVFMIHLVSHLNKINPNQIPSLTPARSNNIITIKNEEEGIKKRIFNLIQVWEEKQKKKKKKERRRRKN